MAIATTQYIDIKKIKLLDNNPRQINKQNFDRLKKSIEEDREYFEDRPLLVNEEAGGELVVIAGNQRLRAAIALGWDTVPVITRTRDDKTKRRIVLKDNIEYGTWDIDEIANTWDLEELKEWDLPELDTKINDILNLSDLGTDFNLPDGDKAPFQQMTFTMADKQADQLKQKLEEIKQTDEYKHCETFGNENSNGNALYCLITRFYGQS